MSSVRTAIVWVAKVVDDASHSHSKFTCWLDIVWRLLTDHVIKQEKNILINYFINISYNTLINKQTA